MRSTLDKLLSWIGLALALVLLVAGGLLTWASSFVNQNVHDQLSAQKITMPTEKTGLSALPQEDQDALKPFAGQPMETGEQAKAYADHFILVHMTEGAKKEGLPATYSEVSTLGQQKCKDAAAQATDECKTINAEKQSLFMGSTLRGLLLYGYAFATIGQIAGYAAIAAFLGAVVFLVLALLGMRHAKKAATVATE